MIKVINPQYKTPDNALVINTTSRSTNWSRGLSPFILGPIDLYDGYISKNVENAYQYSKVFDYYLDDDGNPGENYFKWAKSGWNSDRAERYPMGKGVIPKYSYWNGEKLSYVEARKKIYIPLYSKAVRSTKAYSMLESTYNKFFSKEEILYLWDFDAHSLEPGTFNYWDLWENPNIKVGHAYVLAMMLEGLIK